MDTKFPKKTIAVKVMGSTRACTVTNALLYSHRATFHYNHANYFLQLCEGHLYCVYIHTNCIHLSIKSSFILPRIYIQRRVRWPRIAWALEMKFNPKLRLFHTDFVGIYFLAAQLLWRCARADYNLCVCIASSSSRSGIFFTILSVGFVIFFWFCCSIIRSRSWDQWCAHIYAPPPRRTTWRVFIACINHRKQNMEKRQQEQNKKKG